MDVVLPIYLYVNDLKLNLVAQSKALEKGLELKQSQDITTK